MDENFSEEFTEALQNVMSDGMPQDVPKDAHRREDAAELFTIDVTLLKSTALQCTAVGTIIESLNAAGTALKSWTKTTFHEESDGVAMMFMQVKDVVCAFDIARTVETFSSLDEARTTWNT